MKSDASETTVSLSIGVNMTREQLLSVALEYRKNELDTLVKSLTEFVVDSCMSSAKRGYTFTLVEIFESDLPKFTPADSTPNEYRNLFMDKLLESIKSVLQGCHVERHGKYGFSIIWTE